MTELPRGDVPGQSPGQHRASGLSTQAPPGRDDPGSGYSMYAEEGVSGWAWFTGALMGLVGIFQVITGIVALAGTGYYTVASRNLVIDAGYTTWGWVHLILGLVLRSPAADSPSATRSPGWPASPWLRSVPS